MAAGIRERQPSRAAVNQTLGLRPPLPVRVAVPAARNRRPLVHLLILSEAQSHRAARMALG